MLQTLKNLHKTFYCAAFYRELLLSWKGVGLGFILLISLLNVAQAWYFLRQPVQALATEGEAFFDSLPDLEIAGGTIKATGEMPMKLTLFKSYQDKPVYVLIDTDKQMPDAATLKTKMHEENSFAAVYSNGIVFYNAEADSVETRTPDTMKEHKMTHADWQTVWQQIRAMLTPLSFVTFFIVIFVGQFFLAFTGAVLLYVIAPLFKIKGAFKGFLRLSSAAKFPLAVLAIILPPQPVIQTLIWFCFAVFGLLASRMPPVSKENVG